MRHSLFVTSALAALLASPAAMAQQPAHSTAPQAQMNQNTANPPSSSQTGSQNQAGGQHQVAQQCLTDLRNFAQKMEQDGYWMAGWGNWWGYEPGPARAATVSNGTTGTTGTAPPAAAVPATAAGAPATGAPVEPGPWGPRYYYGVNAPRYQIRVLYSAANVLAERGDQKSCEAVLGDLRNVYDQNIALLKREGVQPGNVESWRKARIAAAKPVTQMQTHMLSLSDLDGTDVRNAKDQYLGTVNDVVLDPNSGKIDYVIVGRGGFFGLGEQYVAVPWKDLKATPGFNLLVLDVPLQALNNAPQVDPDRFANPASFQQNRQKVDQYWQQHLKG